MYSCPECGDSFVSLEGVAMHYVNKEDGDHEKYESKYRVKRAVEENRDSLTFDPSDSSGDSQTVSEDSPEDSPTDSPAISDGGPVEEYSLPTFETVDSGAKVRGSIETTDRSDGSESCCSDPDIQGSVGELYRLESGEIIRLDGGEQLCMNCDTVVEK